MTIDLAFTKDSDWKSEREALWEPRGKDLKDSFRKKEIESINKERNLRQVLTTPAEESSWNYNKTKLIYQDKKGYENICTGPGRNNFGSSLALEVQRYH